MFVSFQLVQSYSKAAAPERQIFAHNYNAISVHDQDKVDEVTLALLFLTLHDDCRAWKGLDWDVMNRLV